ncbi:MAG: crossover junction endodeoxyribonuclease RuvC [Planctomycetota bacterium]
MNIAGIDIGSQLAIAIVEFKSEKIIFIEKIDTRQLTFSELFCVLSDRLKSNRVRYIGYEKPIYHTNIKSMQKYIEKISALKLIASLNRIRIVELQPTCVKKSITGFGKASKHQVKQLLDNVYNIKVSRQSYDISDAIAISFALINKLKSEFHFMFEKDSDNI